jgi:hypothetical protein
MADAPNNPFARKNSATVEPETADDGEKGTDTIPTFNVTPQPTAEKKSGPKGPGSSGSRSSGPSSRSSDSAGPKGPGGNAGTFDDFVIDLRGVTSGGGSDPYIEPGNYVAYVSAVTMESAKTGNNMIIFKYTITDGPYANMTKTDRVVLVEKALWRLDMVLNGLGIDQGDRQLSFADIKRQALERVCVIQVTPDKEYNGNPKTQIFAITPLEGAPVGLTIHDYRAAQAGN